MSLSAGRHGGRPSRSVQRLRGCRREEILHVLPVGLLRAVFPGRRAKREGGGGGEGIEVYLYRRSRHTRATVRRVCCDEPRAPDKKKRIAGISLSRPFVFRPSVRLSVLPLIRAYLAVGRGTRGDIHMRGRSARYRPLFPFALLIKKIHIHGRKSADSSIACS